jgi:hypothetical protein
MVPYLNISLTASTRESQHNPIVNPYTKSLQKPLNKTLYKQPIPNQRYRFLVQADIQSDIYCLSDPTQQYNADFAYIPNYRISVFMNSLFRNIKENRNLDYIEESDDEEEFYDMRPDKYVDLTKTVMMECMYHKKFRRWVPLKVVE